jgi:transketolase
MDLLDEHGYVSAGVFARLHAAIGAAAGRAADADGLVAAAADLVRHNTLLSVARAGTGHLGASLSCADVLAELYFRSGDFSPGRDDDPDRDVLVLSKGHAAPGLYAVLAARGYFPTQRLDRLRRWGVLPGHCHVSTPGVDGSTGSLAMGLSKAVGRAILRERSGRGGRVFAVVGDGELQEGQCWEALLSAAHFGADRLTVIVDDNRVQTDQLTADVCRYGDLPGAIRALGLAVAGCDGHDPAALRTALAELSRTGRPGCLFAGTIKGRGVPFMEHTAVLKTPADRYVWHNRAPDGAQLAAALGGILSHVAGRLERLGVRVPTEQPPRVVPLEPPTVGIPGGIRGRPLVPAFAEAVVALGRADPAVVVLDADLEEDCGLTPFRREFPDRFFEFGIMEQHMVSAASAFCAAGRVPVINSYAAFLSSRANEQIYNLCCDPGTRFLLVGHLAGVIPATPGMSHQAFRDIGCLRSIPGLLLYQPATPEDAAGIVARFGRGEPGLDRLYLRMSAAPSAEPLPPCAPDLPVGHPQVVRPGTDAVVISAGPVMLGECVAAAETLAAEGVSVEVRNHPWPNAFAAGPLRELSARGVPVIIAEDHHRLGGLGEGLPAAAASAGIALRAGRVALDGLPDTGFRAEALAGMGLGRDVVAAKVREMRNR